MCVILEENWKQRLGYRGKEWKYSSGEDNHIYWQSLDFSTALSGHYQRNIICGFSYLGGSLFKAFGFCFLRLSHRVDVISYMQISRLAVERCGKSLQDCMQRLSETWSSTGQAEKVGSACKNFVASGVLVEQQLRKPHQYCFYNLLNVIWNYMFMLKENCLGCQKLKLKKLWSLSNLKLGQH